MVVEIIDLNRVARSIHAVRVGSGSEEPGEVVTVKLMPPIWELKATEILTAGISTPISLSHPLGIETEWRILADDGQTPLPSDQFLILDQPRVPPPPGSDIVSFSKSELSIIFAPSAIIELTTDKILPAPLKRFIVPRVRVIHRIIDTSTLPLPDPPPEIDYPSDWIELEAVQVIVEAIAIPTVLALFRHTNFNAWDEESKPKAGGVLILTPSNSPLKRMEDLQQYLGELQPIVSKLTFMTQFISFFLGIEALSAALAAQPSVVFRSLDEVKNLNNIKLIKWNKPYALDGVHSRGGGMRIFGRKLSVPAFNISGPGFSIPYTDVGNDIEVENEISSLIFLGPPPVPQLNLRFRYRVIECFNETGFDASEGKMNIWVGVPMCVLIRDLGRKYAAYQGFINITPIDARIERLPDTQHYNKRFSSVRFTHMISPPLPGGIPLKKRTERKTRARK